MKIAFIVDAFPKLSETFILDQITGLVDLGHQVEIFAGTRINENEVHPEIGQYNLLDRTCFHNEVPRGRIKRLIQCALLLKKYFFKYPLVLLRSMNFIKFGKDALSLHLLHKTVLFRSKGKFDIIHGHFGRNGHLGAILKEIGIAKKLVTTYHGYDLRLVIKEGIVPEILKKSCDLFLSISDYTYENFMKLGLNPQKIKRHPNGINLKRFPFKMHTEFELAPEPTIILSIARLVNEKGLYYGIQAISKLVNSNSDIKVQYWIIGDGPLASGLKKTAHNLGIENSVRFLGSQSRDQLSQHLQKAHLFFLPSNEEVFPTVLMEAMATGLPIVATSVGAVSELVINNQHGFLVQPKDTEAMAHKLEYLIRNPKKWSTIAKMARKHIEARFDITNLNKELIHIYTDILSSEGSSQ
jgi:colanic acid/amylovoran biosynthesis glycosyltransferase